MDIIQSLIEGIQTDSAEATQAVAQALAAVLPPESVLALQGDLGVGKTTFVRGLGKAWGVQGHLTSPSFGLYQIHQGSARQLVHLDAYRLNNCADFEGLMLEEFLNSPWCLAVEWPERVAQALPPDTYWLEFSILRPHVHHVRLHPR